MAASRPESNLFISNNFIDFCDFLRDKKPIIWNAMKVCSVPLILNEKLIEALTKQFEPNVDFKVLWKLLTLYGIIVEANDEEWHLDREFRNYLLDIFEQENPEFARQVHQKILSNLKKDLSFIHNEIQFQLITAYHTTPVNPVEGIALYSSCFYEARLSNNFASLPSVAWLAKSQEHWLLEYRIKIALFEATGKYYEGSERSRNEAEVILNNILDKHVSEIIAVDASFLLGTILESEDKKKAIELYDNAIKIREDLKLQSLEPRIQNHMRLILAKCYFKIAGILQAQGDPDSLDKADEYYRHGIQFTSGRENIYDTAPLQELIGILQRQGKLNEAKGHLSKITQIEQPFRNKFLDGALNNFKNDNEIGDLYYTISALNHGYGYEQQVLNFDIKSNGAVEIIGTYTILSTSVLGKTDFYLDTSPESDAGVHFGILKSLTPNYQLEKEILDVDKEGIERLQMTIDPPLEPGKSLTYQWAAISSPGTVATTKQELEKANRKYEYIFWDIIVPMKRLEIRATLPVEQTKPSPSVWVELWRIGRFHAPLQTAYRAFLGEDPARVRYSVYRDMWDKVNIKLEIKNPWLSVRYVLAWDIS